MQPLARHHLRTRGKSDTGATREIGAVRRVLVWAPPDEPRRMPEAPAVQSAEVDLTDEGGRKRNPRIKPLVLPVICLKRECLRRVFLASVRLRVIQGIGCRDP